MVKSLTNPFLHGPPPLGSLITAAGQRLAGELDASLGAAGFADLRSAHASVFMSIDPEGSRVTDLAQRTRMTKQAAGELVRYLCGRGYLMIDADALDRRAKRVQLTERGWEAIRVGEQVIAEFDRWLDATVGAGEVARLRDVLTRIAETEPTAR